jgi:hypothetical protein
MSQAPMQQQQPMQPQPMLPTPQQVLPQQIPTVSPQVPVGSIATPATPAIDVQTLTAQNEAYRLQIAQQEADTLAATEQQQQLALAKMKPLEQVNTKMDLMMQQMRTATERAQQYQIAYETEKAKGQFNGELNPMFLDNSSLAALQASIPVARQAYIDFENKVAGKLSHQTGMYNQAMVEGLPPAPVVNGLPTSNQGGSIPQGPAGMQAPYAQHPQLTRDNVYQRNPDPAYGRVYQPQPGSLPQPAAPAPGQTYFQPAYAQPAYAQPAHAPQQPYQQMQPAPAAAPTGEALANARNAIMAARKGGTNRLRAMGLQESPQTAMANASAGGVQVQHTSMPDPVQFAGAGAQSHPMHLAS